MKYFEFGVGGGLSVWPLGFGTSCHSTVPVEILHFLHPKIKKSCSLISIMLGWPQETLKRPRQCDSTSGMAVDKATRRLNVLFRFIQVQMSCRCVWVTELKRWHLGKLTAPGPLWMRI